ncbi:MAG: signal peptidase I [Acidimicrobiales bacterium]
MTRTRIRPATWNRVVEWLALAVIVAVAVVVGGIAAGYRPVVIQTGSMGETAPPKSLIIAVPREASEVVVGDIVVMRRPGATPVTHRVIEIERSDSHLFAITQGDANEAPDAAPYPLEGDELVSRWILPGWGGVIQTVFQRGIAMFVVIAATLVLAYQALHRIWSPAPPTVARTAPPAPEKDSAAKPGRKRHKRRWAVATVTPFVGLLTAGVAWALFVSTDTVTSNDFATAACFDAQLGSVQSGETIHAVDGTVSVPITAVDPTTSFVMSSIRSSSNEPADSVVQVRLASGGTTIEFDRATDAGAPPAVTVAWSVVEYSCGLSVQRGTITGGGTGQIDIPISNIDPAASFALVSTESENTAVDFDADDLFIAELTSATNLQIRSAGLFSPQRSFAWQVVTFDDPGDVSVQNVTATIGAAATSVNVPLLSPADMSTTFLLTGAASVGAGPDIGERLVRAHLADANTVSVSRDTVGDAVDVSIQVVTLRDGSTVRHGTIDLSAGQPVRTVAIERVDPTRSTAISTVALPGSTGGGRTDHAADDVVGEASATFALTDPETVSVQRSASTSNASFGWQVIEWAGPSWWDPNYTFRQRIDVDTTTVAAPDAYTVPLTFDHAALVSSGLALADGSDLRVLRWDGASWSELDRVLDDGANWNQVGTTLWFRTTDPIAAASTGTYWLYFGNSTPALAFADPENVWLLTEDFESGTLGDFEDRTGNTGWYTADPWTRRIAITVPAGRTAANLTDFPLLVSLTSADLAANAQADGSDIRFTAADGSTPLAHEIDGWNGGSGTLEAWVTVPTLTAASGTTVYLYYGAPDAPTQADVRAAWPVEVEAAWHLDRDPAGSAPHVDDSTVGNHDGLSRGGMTSGDVVAGLIGSAIDFDGGDDHLETDPFEIVGVSSLTVSGWVRLDTYTAHGRIVNKASDPFNRIFELAIANTGAPRGRLSLGGATIELTAGAGSITLGAWHHVAMTWDDATLRLLGDGVEVGNTPAGGVVDSDPTMPVTIGGITTQDRQVDGIIDEVRIERVARSTAWLAALEANQRTPATFHIVGAVESGSWFDQGVWAARKPVVIDSSLISADVADFALSVQVVDSQIQATALASGADLVFTASNGLTRLDHAIESWSSGTGTLSAWVSIPTLSAASDTQLFLYYGNPTADDQQDPEAVFGADADLTFLGVR